MLILSDLALCRSEWGDDCMELPRELMCWLVVFLLKVSSFDISCSGGPLIYWLVFQSSLYV
jgi:hypothetical protein